MIRIPPESELGEDLVGVTDPTILVAATQTVVEQRQGEKAVGRITDMLGSDIAKELAPTIDGAVVVAVENQKGLIRIRMGPRNLRGYPSISQIEDDPAVQIGQPILAIGQTDDDGVVQSAVGWICLRGRKDRPRSWCSPQQPDNAAGCKE